MKKFLGSLFLLLVAGGVTVPYISGYYTKKYYYEALKVLSHSQQYKLEIESYDLSWLNSKARVKLTLPQSMTDHLCTKSKSNTKEAMALIFEEDIQHGPLFFAGGSKVQWALAKMQGQFIGTEKDISKTCSNLSEFKWPIIPKKIFSTETMLTFNGALQANFKGQAFEYKKNDKSLKWQGLNGSLNLENKMTASNYKIAFPGGEIGQPGKTVTIKDIKLIGHHQKMSDQDIWLGDLNITLSGLGLKEGQTEVGLNGMSFRHVTRLTDQLVSASAEYNLTHFYVNEIKVGPINMVFSVHHLEPEFLLMLKNIVEMSTPEGMLTGLKKYESKNKENALSIINKQLKQNLEVKIDQIIVQNEKGESSFKLTTSIGGPDVKLNKLEEYMILMPMLKSSGEFFILESMLDSLLEEHSQKIASALPQEFWAQQNMTQEEWVTGNIEKLKEELMKTGVLIKEGKKWISRFNYENSTFMINDKSIKEIMTIYAELNKPEKPVSSVPVVPAAPEIKIPEALPKAP